jgi:hypothetical protein
MKNDYAAEVFITIYFGKVNARVFFINYSHRAEPELQPPSQEARHRQGRDVLNGWSGCTQNKERKICLFFKWSQRKDFQLRE